jgi:hypothetical protein
LAAQVFLVVVSSLLLLILGMRVPDMSQRNVPKPRPRAVVEVSATGHESAGTHAVIAADAVPWHSEMAERTCIVCQLRLQNSKRLLPVFSDQDVARGPPQTVPYRMAT